MEDSLIQINGDSVSTLEVIALITIISLLPSIVVMMTSFTRYIISLSFLRNAMGTQQTPPNMVLTGIAIFLTLFTMSPVLTEVYETAYEPYVNEEITLTEFVETAQVPLKDFMVRNTDSSSLSLFCELSDTEVPETSDEVNEMSMLVIMPAFATSELKRGFLIGFYLYIPFLIIDIVVASTLMSMGMVMLPPSMISTPFKLLLFITVNGWELLFSTLVKGFV